MAIGYNLSYFGGKKVRDYNPSGDPPDPDNFTYRFRVSWQDESGVSLPEKIAHFATQARAASVEAIVIGNYDGDGGDCRPALEALIAHREQLIGLKHIFFGDITFEENEMSWIQNADMSPLLHAYPGLESFSVRGANGLGFQGLQHAHLKKLVVQTGGLPMSVIREILAAQLPALEHLQLWLGSENYGWDGSAEDLSILLDLPQFPRLQYLGICNSEIADEIAAALGDAPVFRQIEELSLHNGNLSDEGARALMQNPALGQLKKLDLHHHYLSGDVQTQLKAAMKALGVKVDLAKGQGATSPEDRYIMVSE